jgi:hypothetical protein
VSEPNDVPGLSGDPVAELEKFIADTEARGESVPAEAHAMLARLRELVAALKGLTDSLANAKPDERSESSGDDDLH